MKYEEKVKLIKNIIDNEYDHIQMKEEGEFVKKNPMQRELGTTRKKALKKIQEMDKENKYWKLLDDLDCAQVDEWINLCMFYFTAGVRAGLTNLKFLNDIEYIENYISLI